MYRRTQRELRCPDRPALNYGYTGTLLDYREYTLSWHALPGLTPRTTLVGPMVLPGTYNVILMVNGRNYTQLYAALRGLICFTLFLMAFSASHRSTAR